MAARKNAQKPTAEPAAPASDEKAADVGPTTAASQEPAPTAAPEDKATETPIADAAPEDQAAAEEAQEVAEGPAAAGVILVITAPRARRRAGIAFGPDPVRIPVDDLTEDQLLAIESDRLLSVRAEKP